jgi:hypothetical protein
MNDLAPVHGIPGAFISRDGRVFRDGKEKATPVSAVGYRIANFSINNKSHTRYVHRLLLEGFIGPCPDGCEALHINGDRLDNRLENLRWGTRKENVADAIRHGTATIGSKNAMAKLSAKDVAFISDMKAMGFTPKEVAPHFGVHVGTIKKLFDGESYRKEFNV